MNERLRDAGLLLRADIRCCNGCGCEEYDYCAADEWDEAIVAERTSQRPTDEHIAAVNEELYGRSLLRVEDYVVAREEGADG
jgi:hypothetical protein